MGVEEKAANPVGRPLKFKTPEDLQEKVDAYFSERLLNEKPVSVTGLCLALETTRDVLDEYANRPEFSQLVKIAKLRVENFYEERLSFANATGSIFALKNFGWRDSQEVNLGGQKDNPVGVSVTGALIDSILSRGTPALTEEESKILQGDKP